MWLNEFFDKFPRTEYLDSSMKECERQLEEDPSKRNPRFSLMCILSCYHDAEGVYHHGNILLEQDLCSNNKARVYFDFGRVELNLQNFEKAIEWYQQSIEHELPEHRGQAYEEMSACYAYLKKYEEAEKALLKAIEINREEHKDREVKTTGNWKNMAMLLGMMERHEEALVYFLERKADDPEDWYLAYGAGLCYQNMGDELRALANYKTAQALNPDSPEIYMNLGGIAFNTEGNIAQAIEYLEKALSLMGEDDRKDTVYLNLSRLYHLIADYDKHEYYKGKMMEALGFPVEWVEEDDDEDDGLEES